MCSPSEPAEVTVGGEAGPSLFQVDGYYSVWVESWWLPYMLDKNPSGGPAIHGEYFNCFTDCPSLSPLKVWAMTTSPKADQFLCACGVYIP